MTAKAENLTPLAHSAQNHCFGCGPANPGGLHLEFFLAEDHSVVSLPTISNVYEGPQGYVHGGVIATLLDETMSKAIRARGHIAMTRHLEVDYLHPVPSGKPLRLEGRLIRTEGRKLWVEARVLLAGGRMLAEGKGLFIEIRPRES